VSQNGNPPAERKASRSSTKAPRGEVVSIKPTDKAAASRQKPAPSDDWPETDWTTSSFALLSGCEVKDYTARLPEQVFERLFKD
jgi:hypothetical protein